MTRLDFAESGREAGGIGAGVEDDNQRLTIAVALCTCNGERYVRELLNSLMTQTRLPDQIVVVDDASDDQTFEVVNSMLCTSGIPVTLRRNETRLGVQANFECAIELCESDYIALADQDDIWVATKLERMAKCVADRVRPPALVYSDLALVDAEGLPTGETFHGRLSRLPDAAQACWFLHTRNFIPGCSLAIRADIRDLALPIPPQSIMHDWWIALLATLTSDAVYLRDPLVKYRLHDDNTMGISTTSDALATTWRHGLWRTGVGNVAAVVRQLEAATHRLEQHGRRPPPLTRRLLRCFELPAGLRFLHLLCLRRAQSKMINTRAFLLFGGFSSRNRLSTADDPYR